MRILLATLFFACVVPAQITEPVIGRIITFDLPVTHVVPGGTGNRSVIPIGPGWSGLISTLRLNGGICPRGHASIYFVAHRLGLSEVSPQRS